MTDWCVVYPYSTPKVEINKRRSLLAKYGLTTADYKKLFEDQKGLCPICELPLGKKFHVDHDHSTGKVRGLLHPNCNCILGFAKDDIQVLRGAIRYLGKS